MTMPRRLKQLLNLLRSYSEELHAYLSDQDIKWDFILSKSHLRRAFYERLNRDLKKHYISEARKELFCHLIDFAELSKIQKSFLLIGLYGMSRIK